jgi:hypothetical protein
MSESATYSAPPGNFLDFVEHEQDPLVGGTGTDARQAPSGFDPFRRRRQGGVSGRCMAGPTQTFLDLAGGGRFAHLPRTDQHLEQGWLPLQSLNEFADDGTFKIPTCGS